MSEEDNFKPLFKYYKSKNPKPDLKKVLTIGPGIEVSASILTSICELVLMFVLHYLFHIILRG